MADGQKSESVPLNLNTATLDELKSVFTKNQAQGIIAAREKGGPLTLKQIRTAAKIKTDAFQKLLAENKIMYEVPTSTAHTPPTSAENSP